MAENLFVKENKNLELIRLISCLLVIINHCNSQVLLYLTPNSLTWYVTIVVFYVTKTAVPAFLMITGYTMLHKVYTWRKIMMKICRVIADLFLFSLLYYLFSVFMGVEKFSIVGYLGKVYHGQITDAFWYLYLYVGLLFTVPFLQRLVKGMERRDFHVFFSLAAFLTCICPTIIRFVPALTFQKDFDLPMFAYGVVYLMIGHYFYLMNTQEHKNSLPPWRLYGEENNASYTPLAPFSVYASVGFLVGMMLGVVCTFLEYQITGGESFLTIGDPEFIPIALESVCVFYLLLKVPMGTGIARMVTLLSANTFGVYLLADFVVARTHMIYFNLAGHMHRLLAVTIQEIAAIILAFSVVWLLRQIAYVKKLL